MKTGEGDLESIKEMKKYVDQVPDDVNIARIVEVGLYNGEPASIIEKAPGRELSRKSHKEGRFGSDDKRKMLQKLAAAPQEHYNKFVQDTEKLLKSGLCPDDAKGNLFYHPKEGFTWIDPLRSDIIQRESKGLDAERPNYPSLLLTTAPNKLNQEDIENIKKVANKLKKAGAKGIDVQKTVEVLKSM